MPAARRSLNRRVVLLDAIDTLLAELATPSAYKAKNGPRMGTSGTRELANCALVGVRDRRAREAIAPAQFLLRLLRPPVTGDGAQALHGPELGQHTKRRIGVNVDQSRAVLVAVEQRRRARVVSVGAGSSRGRVKLDSDLADRVPTVTLPPEKLVVGTVHVAEMGVLPAASRDHGLNVRNRGREPGRDRRGGVLGGGW